MIEGMQPLLAFGLSPSEPFALWIGLAFLAVCEARHRIHGEFTDRTRLAVLLIFVALLALD